ncbi:endonuclease/exonuclease/phosphatase family protein [Amycolatopsis suaedae]|uniref:Endonuclease/exonuclease/phosphatase family protein n=1 Tax=Amycolatopsis suaedae TaxID=2510978 RepID=A0A4Q7JAC4_9PSEU|nr:endonuclease/exonuclease/phosphatase family protein [Amycolatopsis suaedae]RZQ63916.1 endonuclease/exonuclease/phosphatase family protein [Amycolatopsis suaedae]
MRSARRMLAALVAAAALLVPVTFAGTSSAAATVSVLSYNLWHQGSHGGGIEVAIDAIRRSGANVVALQESGNGATSRIANALGWSHTAEGWDIDVISKLPIAEQDWTSWSDTGAQAIAAKIAGVWVYSIHLDHTKYGPYNACFDRDSVQTILADESNRKRQAEQIAEWTGSSPGIVAGDLNTPSHLDWTAATKATHCGYEIAWPATKAFEAKGFRDSFRQIHPDPARTPGDTWSPVEKTNNGRPEPQDRIDYVLYRGSSISVRNSATYGGWNGWNSDHLAVLTTFTVS